MQTGILRITYCTRPLQEERAILFSFARPSKPRLTWRSRALCFYNYTLRCSIPAFHSGRLHRNEMLLLIHAHSPPAGGRTRVLFFFVSLFSFQRSSVHVHEKSRLKAASVAKLFSLATLPLL